MDDSHCALVRLKVRRSLALRAAGQKRWMRVRMKEPRLETATEDEGVNVVSQTPDKFVNSVHKVTTLLSEFPNLKSLIISVKVPGDNDKVFLQRAMLQQRSSPVPSVSSGVFLK